MGGGNERQEESLAGQEQLLMDRLTEVQDKQVSAAARRRNFHTTSRFDKRRLTLPVTLQEINDANKLVGVFLVFLFVVIDSCVSLLYMLPAKANNAQSCYPK